MGSSVEWIRWLAVAVNVVLPILVALVTARVAGGTVKALLLLVLASLSALLTTVLDLTIAGEPVNLSQLVFDALVAFAIAVAAHFGLWKPVNITGSTGVIQLKVPAGVGGRHAA